MFELLLENILYGCSFFLFQRNILQTINANLMKSRRVKESPIYLEEVVVQRDDIQRVERQNVKSINNHLENYQRQN